MNNAEFQKLLDLVAEKWLISASHYTNCISERTNRAKNIAEHMDAPINGYPVVLKFRDRTAQCKFCPDICVNQEIYHTYCLDKTEWQHRCGPCGKKMTHKEYKKNKNK